MSNYKSTLQTNNSALSANNISLQSLIEQANNLPDAGSGGSGSTVETCTVNLINDSLALWYLAYIDANGELKVYDDLGGLGAVEFPTSFTTYKNSLITLVRYGWSLNDIYTANCEVIYTSDYSNGVPMTAVIHVSNYNATITV